MKNLDDLARLRKRVDASRQEAAKAAGAFEQAIARLRDDHGCETLEDGEAKLEKLDSQTKKAETLFTEALERFEREYGGNL